MRIWAVIWLALGPALVRGEPLVPAYDRFHASAPSAQGGAVLYSELGCANCHGGSQAVIPRKGPSLQDLSSRVDFDWTVAFLNHPSSGRTGSPMPQMVHGLSDIEVRDLVAYLGSLGKGLKIKDEIHANAARGSALYHEIGCAACHPATADFHPPGGHRGLDAPGLVSWPDLKKKYSFATLRLFLSDTSRYRPDGRMPGFNLSPEDANDLAAHLLDQPSSDPREYPRLKSWPTFEKESIARGRDLFASQRCAACHEFPGGPKAPEILPLNRVPSGTVPCWIGDKPGVPWYQLSEGQKQALLLYLGNENEALPKDNGFLTLAALNCLACHEREGTGGASPQTSPFFIGEESLGDSGRLPPPLTGIGFKLQKEWLVGVFEGKNRVRPYLKTRMPTYSAQAKALADWLAHIDARPQIKPLELRDEDLEAGRKLLGLNGGVNCITCHHWAEKRSLGIPGPDLSGLDQRMRPEWFRDYLLDPPGYRAGTLMPPLWPGGQSMIRDVLAGDTTRQIAAIWSFIERGAGHPEGYVDTASGRFELQPVDRPIIQRTFFEKAGARAILVGFPGSLHLAFDGERACPTLLWKGRFFDAYETWFLRKALFQKPLSDDQKPFEIPARPARFRGYTLDEEGNPAFRVERDGRIHTDHYRVAGDQIIRSVTWEEGDEVPILGHPSGMEIETVTKPRQLIITYTWK